MGRRRTKLKKARKKFWIWFLAIKAALLIIVLVLLWYAFKLFRLRLMK